MENRHNIGGVSLENELNLIKIQKENKNIADGSFYCPYCGTMYEDSNFNIFENELNENISYRKNSYNGNFTCFAVCQECGYEFQIECDWDININICINEIVIERIRYDEEYNDENDGVYVRDYHDI